MRTEELNDLNSALNPEAIDELFAGLGTTKRPSPPQQLTASTDNTPPVRRRRLSSQGPTTRNVATQNSEGIDWVSWFYKLVIVACFAPLTILLLTSYSWSPFREHPAAQPIRKMLTERRVVTGDIAEFDVGMRAMGQNPLVEQIGTASEPDPKTSRKLVITMKKESGRNLFINLLRSLDWIEAFAVERGETFFLDLPEMGAIGDAHVEAILPCPPIADGPGNVVTGTFAHEADLGTRILSVTFANGAHIKGVTDNHPFFSVDANDFLPVGQMREGDYVEVIDGVTRITKIDSRFARPGEMLYNLEIHNQHVYQATTAGILVHNTCWNDFQRGTRGLFGSRTDAAAAYRNLRTSAYAPYKGPYSKVGHSFTKHAAAQRAGSSVFPPLAGNDAAKEATARSIFEGILTDPAKTITMRSHSKYGQVIEIMGSNGRGAKFDALGNFLYFFE